MILFITYFISGALIKHLQVAKKWMLFYSILAILTVALLLSVQIYETSPLLELLKVMKFLTPGIAIVCGYWFYGVMNKRLNNKNKR